MGAADGLGWRYSTVWSKFGVGKGCERWWVWIVGAESLDFIGR